MGVWTRLITHDLGKRVGGLIVKSIGYYLLMVLFSAWAVADPVADLEGKSGYERRASITRLADTAWGGHQFSIERGVEILRGLTGTDRYYAAKSLLGSNRERRILLPGPLSVGEVDTLLEGTGRQRQDLILHLADSGAPAGNLGVEEVRTLIGELQGGAYDRTLRSLLGSNRAGKNYALVPFGSAQVDRLLAAGSDRAEMIRYMADRALLEGGFTVDEAERMMQSQSGMDRHDSVKALLGSNSEERDYLTLPLGFADAKQLLNGVALRSELIHYFSDHGVFAGRLRAREVVQLLDGVEKRDRYSVVRSLLGFNEQERSYLQTPLAMDDAGALLEGMAYRDEMIGLLADQGGLVEGLSVADATLLLGELARADRHDALLPLLGNNEQGVSYLELPVTAEGAVQLMERAAYRDELIDFMVDRGQLAGPLSADQALELMTGLVGEVRYKTLLSLLGSNEQEVNYLPVPMELPALLPLLERIANRKAAIGWVADHGMIKGELGEEETEQLLGRLYGEEREQATAILKGKNRQNRSYLSEAR